MKRMCPAILILVISAACSTASTAPAESTKQPISLATVEKLKMGVTTADEANQLFGKPDKTLRMKDGDNLWVYYDSSGPQRLALTLDEQGRTVITALLVINDEDHISQPKAAFSHFPHAKFKSRKIPHQGRDYYYEDLVYEAPEQGISFSVNEVYNTVAFLAFDRAIPRRLADTK